MCDNTTILFSNGQKIMKIMLSELKKWKIEIPDWQRFVDIERVEDLFHKMSSRNSYRNTMHSPIQTGIVVAEWKDKLFLIDGQHRFKAYEKLHSQFHTEMEILVNIIPAKSINHISELCRMLNNSRPFDLPENPECFIPAKNITEILHHKYYAYFTSSTRPRRPNLNADQFSQRITALLSDGKDPSSVYDEIENVNTKYEHSLRHLIDTVNNQSVVVLKQFMYPGDTEEKIIKYVNVILKKVVTHKFYLGLYKNYEWIAEISGHNTNIQSSNASKKTASPTKKEMRVPFSKHQRHVIWNAKMGSPHKLEGYCIACGRILDVDTFHVGHKRAVAKGGNNDMDNLCIICANCNLTMGTKSLEEFTTMLYHS